MPNLDFAQLGALFNATTDELYGGVSPINQHVLLNQLNFVQQGVQNLVNNGTFTDPATITHAQNIADQINFLTDQVANYGTNGNFGTAAFNPKFINDVQRDIQDIVAGDPNLAAAAAPTHGFQQTSNLLAPPTPFADNAAQDAFLVNFGNQSNALGAQAVAAINSGDPAQVTQAINDLHAFQATNIAFVDQQSGLYQARFQNELGMNSVSWTAANELVNALQTNNANLAQGAANVLSQNAMDIQGNNSFNGIDIGTGQPVVPVVNGGIPASIPDVATAGAVFNDFTTKVIGGVYAGNQAGLVNDLNATATGLQNAITNQGLTGQALTDAQTVIGLLGQEAGLVGGIDTANPTQSSLVNHMIGQTEAQILNVVNNDATLAGLANGGFVPNPVGAPTQGQALVAGGPPGQTGAAGHQGMAGMADASNSIGDLTQMPHSTMDFSHMWHHA